MEAICCIFILFIQTFLVVQHFDVSLIRSLLIEDLWDSVALSGLQLDLFYGQQSELCFTLIPFSVAVRKYPDKVDFRNHSM